MLTEACHCDPASTKLRRRVNLTFRNETLSSFLVKKKKCFQNLRKREANEFVGQLLKPKDEGNATGPYKCQFLGTGETREQEKTT